MARRRCLVVRSSTQLLLGLQAHSADGEPWPREQFPQCAGQPEAIELKPRDCPQGVRSNLKPFWSCSLEAALAVKQKEMFALKARTQTANLLYNALGRASCPSVTVSLRDLLFRIHDYHHPAALRR